MSGWWRRGAFTAASYGLTSVLPAHSIESLFVRTGRAGDHEAFERALRTSEHNAARLIIASVVDELPPAVMHLMASSGISIEQLGTAEFEFADVDGLVETARRRSVEASGQVLKGNSLVEIIRVVVRERHDLLIKAAEPALAHGIGTLALAVILFDGGLSTPIAAVRSAWKPAVLLATVGVLITAVLTGLARSRVHLRSARQSEVGGLHRRRTGAGKATT